MKSVLAMILAFFMTISTSNDIEVYIFWGQSNMNGQGSVSDLTDSLMKYNQIFPNIQIYGGLTNGSFDSLEPGVNCRSTYSAGLDFGPELSFLYEAAKNSSQIIYAIKYAPGGVPLEQTAELSDWNILSNELYDTLFYDDQGGAAYLSKALDTLIALYPDRTIKIKAIIGVHGEQDAIQKSKTYETDYTNMLNQIKTDYTSDNVDIENVIVVHNRLKDITAWASQGAIDTIKIAQTNIANSSNKYGMVLIDDLELKPDQIHLTSESDIELGLRLYYKYDSLKNELY